VEADVARGALQLTIARRTVVSRLLAAPINLPRRPVAFLSNSPACGTSWR